MSCTGQCKGAGLVLRRAEVAADLDPAGDEDARVLPPLPIRAVMQGLHQRIDGLLVRSPMMGVPPIWYSA